MSSVLTSGETALRYCLVAQGCKIRVSKPASAKARWTGTWYCPVRSMMIQATRMSFCCIAWCTLATAARNGPAVCSTVALVSSGLPKKSAILQRERCLAGSKQTKANRSTPICRTSVANSLVENFTFDCSCSTGAGFRAETTVAIADLRGIEETGNNLPQFHNPEDKLPGKKYF